MLRWYTSSNHKASMVNLAYTYTTTLNLHPHTGRDYIKFSIDISASNPLLIKQTPQKVTSTNLRATLLTLQWTWQRFHAIHNST